MTSALTRLKIITFQFIKQHIRIKYQCYINVRLVFSQFFYIRGNLGNVKEKPTKKN